MEERKTIKNGLAWIRYFLIPVMIALLGEIIYYKENRWQNVVFFMLCVILFYLLKRMRKLQHDNQNFYIIRGTKENVIPFTSIISIKRSRSKVNGSRFWIITYTDEKNKTRKCRYFSDFFNKEFHECVRLENPSVIIWTHPFFNH